MTREQIEEIKNRADKHEMFSDVSGGFVTSGGLTTALMPHIPPGKCLNIFTIDPKQVSELCDALLIEMRSERIACAAAMSSNIMCGRLCVALDEVEALLSEIGHVPESTRTVINHAIAKIQEARK